MMVSAPAPNVSPICVHSTPSTSPLNMPVIASMALSTVPETFSHAISVLACSNALLMPSARSLPISSYSPSVQRSFSLATNCWIEDSICSVVYIVPEPPPPPEPPPLLLELSFNTFSVSNPASARLSLSTLPADLLALLPMELMALDTVELPVSAAKKDARVLIAEESKLMR